VRFAVAAPCYVDFYKEAIELERLGFDGLWLFDSPMVHSDVYAALALVAVNTARLRIAPGVAVARNRVAPVTAHSIATINQLAPGRVALGFSTGNTARRAMGMRPVGLDEFRDEALTIRRLLHGENAPYREAGRESIVRLVHQHHGFILLEPPIPLIMGATAPKSLRIAGEVGDGLITSGSDPESLKAWVGIAKAARPAQRSRAPFEVAAMVGVYVTAAGESAASPGPREALGPWVLAHLRLRLDTFKGPVTTMDPVLADFAREVAKLPEPRHLWLYENYQIGVGENFRRFVTAEAINATCLCGPSDFIADAIGKVFLAGADEIVLRPHANGRTLTNYRRFVETVMRPMRGKG
jgi:alkanesulfonate monooxygenase SsuD/methylene tetrahydromethanopterin reductase-like flavin-dependent oxidoreductase (luciferase family)